jgi:beta-lactamase class A
MTVDGSESSSGTARSRAERRTGPRPRRRSGAPRRGFASTEKALDALAASGARVSVRVSDLDRGTPVLAGDDFVTLPVAGMGIVPLLIEVAARFDAGTLDPLGDLAVLAASTGDALAANALLGRVGLDAVRARLGSLGMPRTALLDRFRDDRGPDDAPHYALGTARELAAMFAALVNTDVVSPGVSAQVSEWLSLNHDLSLVGSVTGLDPFAHDDDKHELLFVNKTGRADGIRAEAGVLAGPRSGVSYALLVGFDDLSMSDRLRAHEAFRAFGLDLMEYVF